MLQATVMLRIFSIPLDTKAFQTYEPALYRFLKRL